MSHPSEPDLLVLTGLRLTSFAPTDRVATAAGLPAEEVERRLASLAARGLARQKASARPGWLLTPAGRAEGEARLAAELDALGLRPRVAEGHRRFLGLNQRLLGACTAWQLREVGGVAVPNDHADPAHDAAAVAELCDVDDAIGPVCEDLADALCRFTSYRPRLSEARRRVEAGQGDWFTKPTIDSYHSVWFELHEHLLASLGLERASEPRHPGSGS